MIYTPNQISEYVTRFLIMSVSFALGVVVGGVLVLAMVGVL
jgi:hypothetical protein